MGEEEYLKPYEEELGYHVPDEIADEIVNFRIGVWQGVPEGKARSENTSNTVALSCYLAPRKNNPFFVKAHKEIEHIKRLKV